MNKNIVFSLCYNTTDAVEATMQDFHLRNKGNFEHYIVDIGFPLINGSTIPDDIELAKEKNTEVLKSIAKTYGSKYVKFPNVGVQQNHTQFYNYINPDDSDVLIALDVDEIVVTDNWVQSMADSLRSGKMGLISLLQEDIEQYILKEHYIVKKHNSYRLWVMKAMINMALIGFSGEFLNKINRTLLTPDHAKIYGHLEMVVYLLAEHGYDWAILPDYVVRHNVQEGTLFREYKNWLIHQNITPQIPFEKFLENKKAVVV